MKHRWLYPPNWDEVARACKERAGWCVRRFGAYEIAAKRQEVKSKGTY